jgi:hypothetical protein
MVSGAKDHNSRMFGARGQSRKSAIRWKINGLGLIFLSNMRRINRKKEVKA